MLAQKEKVFKYPAVEDHKEEKEKREQQKTWSYRCTASAHHV